MKYQGSIDPELQTVENLTFSIVIVLSDLPFLLNSTLDSIRDQTYSSYEIIIVETGFDSFIHDLLRVDPKKIYKVFHSKNENRAQMLNEGVKLARGKYIQFLKPGDVLISRFMLSDLTELIQKNPHIDMFYSGYLIRNGESAPYAYVYPFTRKKFQTGELPAELHSCFYKRQRLVDIKGFNNKYYYRPELDLICKFFSNKKYNVQFVKKVFVDYEYRKKTLSQVVYYSLETLWVILIHFGPVKAFRWWFVQDHYRIFKWIGRGFKKAFWSPK